MQLKVGDNPLTDARRVKAIWETLPNTVGVFLGTIKAMIKDPLMVEHSLV